MAHSPVKLTVAAIAGYAIIAAWSLAMIVAGAMYLPERWAMVSVACGAVIALGAAATLIRGAWHAAGLWTLLATAGGLLAAGIVLGNATMAAIAVLAIVILGALAMIVVVLLEMAAGRTLAATPAASAGDGDLRALLAEIHEHTMLSDSAKRVLFRDREIDMLRSAIEEDIARGDHNAAISLCDDMARLFGYREEAEAFRARIAQSRTDHYENQVQAAIEQLDGYLAVRDWPRAHQEAARIRRLFPESHLVHDLDERINGAREACKRELEQRFIEAAQREEIESSMDLLRQLDRYLTREEAGRLAPLAQGVVMKHRKNLETHFKLAVADRMWAEAAEVGQTIMNEFPNTKMAEEVRSMIQVLRTRATQAAMTAQASAS
jgi:hypothetical protein